MLLYNVVYLWHKPNVKRFKKKIMNGIYFDFELFQVDWISLEIEKMNRLLWSPILGRCFPAVYYEFNCDDLPF